MKLQRFLSIPVSAVFLLMCFVYYTTVFVFIEDWVGLQRSAGSFNALIFTFLCSICLFSFFACVLIEPGHVPSSYVPDIEETTGSDKEHEKNVAQLRRCDKCSTYKPPRAHHCRVCRRCVLRMDHHCLWINNCVGYWNYKAFFMLVLYATIGSIYSTSICGALMIGLSGTLGTLLGWHIYLIIQNMTTIEYYEGIRQSWLARKSGQSYQHPFNLGVYRNITSVLGPNMVKWLCPTSVSHLKDGLTFPIPRDGS
ncbi:putative protein S-acyltransferase 15 [Morella rubra]|uniref:S-acyltransferase n=1 Tax=Morella rubra TaxID=262757 RepID=A0A6A1W1R9_9ROSI|nr:putative protein S-acyltransferase 15 [Morella rubra]